MAGLAIIAQILSSLSEYTEELALHIYVWGREELHCFVICTCVQYAIGPSGVFVSVWKHTAYKYENWLPQ